MSATVVALAFAAPPVDPSPQLRERILDAARAERQNVVPLRPRGSWMRLRAAAVAAAVAVAACLVIGLGIWNVSLSATGSTTRDEALRSVPLDGANGSVVVGGGNKGVLVVSNLAAAPAGKTYEAWVIDDGAAAPAGTFARRRHGRRAASSTRSASGAVVAVTVERDGGVEQPTTQAVHHLAAGLTLKADS